MTKITITKEAMTKIMAMTDADLVLRLRARPFRFGGETEDEAKARRQRDREVAADRIEALTGEVQRWQGMFDEKHNLMLEHKARAKTAEAERDRLSAAIMFWLEAQKRETP